MSNNKFRPKVEIMLILVLCVTSWLTICDSACTNNQILVNNFCVPCTFTFSATGQASCSTCQAGYYLVNNVCTKVNCAATKGYQPSALSNSGTCVCDKGFYASYGYIGAYSDGPNRAMIESNDGLVFQWSVATCGAYATQMGGYLYFAVQDEINGVGSQCFYSNDLVQSTSQGSSTDFQTFLFDGQTYSGYFVNAIYRWGISNDAQGRPSGCRQCSMGWYSPVIGASACLPCAAGYSSAIGFSSCQMCPVGSFSSSLGSACILCGVGHYSASIGATSCSPCPNGVTTLGAGQSACSPCPAGFFYVSGGVNKLPTCQICPPNTYSYGLQCVPFPITSSNWNQTMHLAGQAKGTISPQGVAQFVPNNVPASLELMTGSSFSFAYLNYFERVQDLPSFSFSVDVQLPTQGADFFMIYIGLDSCATLQNCGATSNVGIGLLFDLYLETYIDFHYLDAGNCLYRCGTPKLSFLRPTSLSVTGIWNRIQIDYKKSPVETWTVYIGGQKLFTYDDPDHDTWVVNSGSNLGIWGSSADFGQLLYVQNFQFLQMGSCNNTLGSVASVNGSSSNCELCYPGSYTPSIGGLTCQLCPPGSFSNNYGSTACLLCPPGSYSSGSGASRCQNCLPGSWSGRSGLTQCISCEAGTYGSSVVTEGCLSCDVGTYSPTIGAINAGTCMNCTSGYFCPKGSPQMYVCPDGYQCDGSGSPSACQAGFFCTNQTRTPCGPGYYSEGGAVECQACLAGYYNPNERSTSKRDCLQCPPNTITFTNSSRTQYDCVCDKSYYRNPSSTSILSSDSCLKCGTAFICESNNLTISQIQPADGFYLVFVNGFAPNSTSLRTTTAVYGVACLSDFACLNSTCSFPYVGFLCSKCLPGAYKSRNSNDCIVCEGQLLNISVALGSLIFGVCVLAFQISNQLTKTDYVLQNHNLLSLPSGSSQSVQASREKVVEKKKILNSNSVLMRLTLNHLQVIAIVGNFNFSWPPVIGSFFTLSTSVSSGSIFSVSTFSGGLKCLFYQYAYPLPVNDLLLCVASLSINSFIILSFWLCIRTRKRPYLKSVSISLLVLNFSAYPELMRLWFRLFSCMRFEGDNQLRLINEYDMICYSRGHILWLIGVALPIGIVLIVGLPLFATFKLCSAWRNNLLKDVEMLSTFGFLYDGYREGYWYWEFITLVRKIFLSTICVFLQSSDSVGIYEQGLAAVVIFVISLVIQAHAAPYNEVELNMLESLGLAVSFATLYLGLWTFATTSGTTQALITAAVFLLNGVWAMFVGYKLLTGSNPIQRIFNLFNCSSAIFQFKSSGLYATSVSTDNGLAVEILSIRPNEKRVTTEKKNPLIIGRMKEEVGRRE